MSDTRGMMNWFRRIFPRRPDAVVWSPGPAELGVMFPPRAEGSDVQWRRAMPWEVFGDSWREDWPAELRAQKRAQDAGTPTPGVHWTEQV